jgi:hypothetical protein
LRPIRLPVRHGGHLRRGPRPTWKELAAGLESEKSEPNLDETRNQCQKQSIPYMLVVAGLEDLIRAVRGSGPTGADEQDRHGGKHYE